MEITEQIAAVAAELQAARQGNKSDLRHKEAVLVPKMARLLAKQDAVKKRFMAKVAYGESDCWFWFGSIDELGYGRCPAMGEAKAHRLSYVLANGPIPKGMHVLHSCDVRNCVNPAHLSLGTHKENMREMHARGRAQIPDVVGEKNPMAKLNRGLVADIRAMAAQGMMQNVIAAKVGISKMAVSRVVRRESWK